MRLHRAIPSREAAAVAVVMLGGCTERRVVPASGAGGPEGPRVQVPHVEGWADKTSGNFHGCWLNNRRKAPDASAPCVTSSVPHPNDELARIADCQACHGKDYQGGASGSACTGSGCHTKPGGPEHCTTCHGSTQGPMPVSGPYAGAHAIHEAFCTDCHEVPQTIDGANHLDGTIDITFHGLALAGGATPTWDSASKTCSEVYCHRGAQTASTPAWTRPDPVWKTPEPVTPCDACHETPPASTHARWAFAATATPPSAGCPKCHPTLPDAKPSGAHLNRQVDLNLLLACDTCHGHGPLGVPAPALDGSTDRSARGVGAHQRHLDAALPGRIGRVMVCSTCHPVPTGVFDPGHLDHPLPATVWLPFGGVYEPTSQTCTVSCHDFGASAPACKANTDCLSHICKAGVCQAPAWTDDSGSVPSCTGCHGFPPLTLRTGTAHTQSLPVLSECLTCHPWSPTTHVDGTVELLP